MTERPGAERATSGQEWESYGSYDPREDHAALGGPPPPRGRLDFAPLFALLDAVVRTVPRDLREQFISLVREALLTLRALIDWYLDRLDSGKREPEVEDIPID
jgi:hypothetical protein